MVLSLISKLRGRPLGWVIRRALYNVHEITHPDEPWISQGAIRFCAKQLHAPMVGLEWGSGRSTAWYAQRLGKLVSIEFDKSWYERVLLKLRAQGLRHVELRYLPLEHP